MNKHLEAYSLRQQGHTYRQIAKIMNHKDLKQGFIAFKLVKEVEEILNTFK